MRRVAAFLVLCAASPAVFAQSAEAYGTGIGAEFFGQPAGVALGGGAPEFGSGIGSGVSSTLTLSDNIFRRSREEDEDSGYRLEISPYVTGFYRTARADASLRYRLRAFHWAGGGETDHVVRHEVNARGNTLLAGDWLGVRGYARTFYPSISAFGAQSFDPAAENRNVARITQVEVAPYVQGRIGTFAGWRGEYSLTRTETSDDVRAVLSRQIERVMASMHSGPRFNRWGWGLNSTGIRREFANGLELNMASTVASLWYLPMQELRLGVSANHLYIERLTNTDGEDHGWGPGFSVDWTPSLRTSLHANIVRQYYGGSESLAINHRTTRWTFGLRYLRNVFTSNTAGMLFLNPADLLAGAGVNPVLLSLLSEGTLHDTGTIVGGGVVNDALVRGRTMAATVGYLLPRGSITFTGFRSVRETVIERTLFVAADDPLINTAFGRFDSRGGTLALRVPLTPRTETMLSGTVSDTRSLSSADRARVTYLMARLTTRLDARTSVTTGVRRTVQSHVAGSVSGYDENSVFGTVDVRF